MFDHLECTSNEWTLHSNPDCEPIFVGITVNYTALPLPDCAEFEEQFNDSIKYVIKIKATKPHSGGTGQLRAYDHLYYV